MAPQFFQIFQASICSDLQAKTSHSAELAAWKSLNFVWWETVRQWEDAIHACFSSVCRIFGLKVKQGSPECGFLCGLRMDPFHQDKDVRRRCKEDAWTEMSTHDPCWLRDDSIISTGDEAAVWCRTYLMWCDVMWCDVIWCNAMGCGMGYGIGMCRSCPVMLHYVMQWDAMYNTNKYTHTNIYCIYIYNIYIYMHIMVLCNAVQCICTAISYSACMPWYGMLQYRNASSRTGRHPVPGLQHVGHAMGPFQRWGIQETPGLEVVVRCCEVVLWMMILRPKIGRSKSWNPCHLFFEMFHSSTHGMIFIHGRGYGQKNPVLNHPVLRAIARFHQCSVAQVGREGLGSHARKALISRHWHELCVWHYCKVSLIVAKILQLHDVFNDLHLSARLSSTGRFDRASLWSQHPRTRADRDPICRALTSPWDLRISMPSMQLVEVLGWPPCKLNSKINHIDKSWIMTWIG